ncbi:reticulocalbin-1-like [Mizuhopecten yessoensis]|uniref:Reticulocalbin-3 n=1 Tax=Mizuhopecten yessoensis TaxID=6573 RepID=A0A210PJI5_MIZYE|nr:reticulocalbin-1-like [Mizuhopecten yessoensis]OWF36647.1 Calumenin [Mizuhopecten yessoensis]
MRFLRLTVVLAVLVTFARGLSLSDLPHEVDGKHNDHYDHEVFLGKDNAEEFEQLTEQESKRRLGLIVDKIDKDGDGRVTEGELKDWIWYVRISFVANDTNRVWIVLEHEDNKLSWPAYLRKTFGYADENVDSPHSPLYKHRERVKEERRRWEAADINKDNQLTKTEFMYFLHPEEGNHTKDILVHEYLDKLDTNKDGKIDVEEFIADVHPSDKRTQDPTWISLRRKEFTNYRDKDSDGVLDFEEMREWINPSNYNPALVEARHLIHHSDLNKDEVLTKEEVLTNFNMFVGSQALDYGEVLKNHDEF